MSNRFEPTEKEIEDIKQIRKNKYKRSGISRGGNFYTLCSIPYDEWRRQQYFWRSKGRAGSWTHDDNELAKYLAKNPQYKIGNPLG